MNAPLSPALRQALQSVTLDDRYTLEHGRAWMSGIHALVRLPMLQHQLDARAGRRTAGFISGYRGSPLGNLDQNLWQAKAHLERNAITFQPGLNEELAATAVWGSQQVGLFPGARYDGVHAMWYGKGPGVDRCGDVFKHANAAGTSPLGGVLVLAGDDHPAKSSTLPHQSEHILKAAMIPVLFPASVQEYLDFGLHGWAMSRYSGLWVSLKCITDIVEASASVELDPDRIAPVLPDDFPLPEGGLNIRWPDTPLQQEARLLEHKVYAALAYARRNGLNRIEIDAPQARFGIMASGKAYLDTRQALADLGLDDATCRRIGLRLLKVGMVWPLDAQIVRRFADGLDEIVVVEEKRQVLEYQVKEELFSRLASGQKVPRVIGKFDEQDGGEWSIPRGRWVLPAAYEFSPAIVARAVGGRLLRLALPDDVRAGIQARLAAIDAKERELATPRTQAERKPWFCSGCPHNTSTRVPEGSRAVAGIGCHYMVTWMDRSTDTFTQMGGEGAPWIGQAPFTETPHIFANLGDGTYQHSGSLAIRAARAAGVNITYKILFNDAVAMTGGQPVDGTLPLPALTRQLAAEGIERIALVSDDPERYGKDAGLAPQVTRHHRDDLDAVQRELRELPGVTALVYDQTCASEKRRRRKRGTMAQDPRRVVINPRVCEGCGDCSTQSNCLSVEPLETPFGRKRRINQSTCNQDFSCLKGFCPSFVTLDGATPRKPKPTGGSDAPVSVDNLPEPNVTLDRPWGIVVAGVGGTGVVTIGQLIGMAAHLEGVGCSVLDMAGLAQKGGAVLSHIVLAPKPEDIHSTRVALAAADLLLATDLVVATSNEAVARLRAGRSHVLLNADIAPTAAFVRERDWALPEADLLRVLTDGAGGTERLLSLDAAALATQLLGDAIYANPLLLGAACQRGWLPVTPAALERAIELNGTAVANNLAAFRWGRRLAHDPAAVPQPAAKAPMQVVTLHRAGASATTPEALTARVKVLSEELTAYQSRRYAQRFERLVATVERAEEQHTGTRRLSAAVAETAFRLMAYKDEYEVARLHTDPAFLASLDERFTGDWQLRFHFATPLLARRAADGTPTKRTFGPRILPVLRTLARLRGLRGTPFDPFGYQDERRQERALIRDFERLVQDELLPRLAPDTLTELIALAQLPLEIRGYGHIKAAAMDKVRIETEQRLSRLAPRHPSNTSAALA